VWNVRQPRDHGQRQQRIEIPGHKAEDVLRKCRKNPDRSDRDNISERDHHRRDEDRDQDQRLEILPAGHVGAHHQESEQGTKRHRDCGHAAGDHDCGPERLPEIRVSKDERIGKQAEPRRTVEKRRGEEALVAHK
jgi:hypothetical protein